jgi:hypothetical protein
MCKMIFRILLLLVLVNGSWTASNAQSNAIEAKAAYLLAEESYGKGDMRAALDYIGEATTKLGSANAKLSYLKIMILKEMSVKDTGALSKLDNAILEFEKAPDVADFNEEKTLEIIKIKLERTQKTTAAAAMNQQMATYQEKLGWYIGMSIDSMIVLHKSKFDAYFKDKPKMNGKLNPNENLVFWANGNISELLGIQQGKLFTYTRYLDIYSNETANFEHSKQAEKAIMDDLKNHFGFIPEPAATTTALPEVGGSTTTYIYNWKGPEVMVQLVVYRLATKAINTSSIALQLAPSVFAAANK